MKVRQIAIAAVLVVGGLAAAASGGSSSSSSGGSSSGGSSSAKAVGIGKPAADGKFTFTVNNVQCGIPTIGDTANGLGATAQGQFCKVNVTVANTGTEAQDLSSDNQYAFDAKGSKFSTSSDAEISSNQDSVLFTTINPGNSVTGDLYYDIPTTDSITKFEFHDSLFSDGVTVDNK